MTSPQRVSLMNFIVFFCVSIVHAFPTRRLMRVRYGAAAVGTHLLTWHSSQAEAIVVPLIRSVSGRIVVTIRWSSLNSTELSQGVYKSSFKASRLPFSSVMLFFQNMCSSSVVRISIARACRNNSTTQIMVKQSASRFVNRDDSSIIAQNDKRSSI